MFTHNRKLRNTPPNIFQIIFNVIDWILAWTLFSVLKVVGFF